MQLAGHVLHDPLVAPIDQSADPVRRHVGGQGGGPAAAVPPDDQQRRLLAADELELARRLAARQTAPT